MSAQRVSSGRQFRSNVGCLVIACTCSTATWASTPLPDGGVCPGGVVFQTFCNLPIGGAILTIDLEGNLVVSNKVLPVAATLSAAQAGCTAPETGDEIEPDDPAKAGDDGFTVELDDTKIPDHVTSYFVELEEYWGQSSSDPPWETDPIPIGFRTSGSDIIGCANFDVCPIFCPTVKVKFTKEDENGEIEKEIECPGGDLFSYASVKNETFEIQKIIAHGTCPGGGCSDETSAKKKTRLHFKLAQIISGIERDDGCTGDPGPFEANHIFIQPDRDNCSKEDCPAALNDGGVSETTDEAVVAGGSTPRITKIKLLAAGAESFGNTATGTLWQFTILGEGYCSLGDPDCFDEPIPTVSEWGLMVMSLLSLIAGTLVLKHRTVALS